MRRCPPIKAAELMSSSELDDKACILPVVRNKAEPLLQHGARHAFMSMSTHWLSKLHTEVQVPHKGAKPSTEAALARALVGNVLPQLSAEQVEQVKQRKFKAGHEDLEESALVGNPGGLALARNLLDDDACEAIEQLQKQAGVTSRVASSSSSSRAYVSITGSKTPAWASELIPHVKGCSIKKDIVRHFRWQGFYPSRLPPKTWSKTYGEGAPDDAALCFVLKQIWVAHEAAAGESCPFDIQVGAAIAEVAASQAA